MIEEGQGQPSHVIQNTTTNQVDPNFNQWMVESGDLIEDFEHDLNSEVWTTDSTGKKGSWQVLPGTKPIINRPGSRRMVSLIRPYSNKAFSLSNLKPEDINMLALDVANELTIKLMMDHQMYDVNKVDLTLLKNLIVHLTLSTLKRAEHAKQLNVFAQTTESREVINQNERRPVLGGLPKALRRVI